MADLPQPVPSTDDKSAAPIRVALAAGADLGSTVAAAIDAVGGIACASCILDEMTIVGGAGLGDARGPAREAVEVVGTLAREQVANVRTIAPPAGLGLLGAARRGASRAGWTSVDVSARGTRLTEILIPRELAAIGSLVAVTSIAGERRERPPLAIGLWTTYVHPRHALGARLTGERYGLAAEIALAFAPRLYVITGDLGAQTVVVATADAIAAELVGLAFHRERLRRLDTVETERPGPWMDPLVQRATELRLGVTTPEQLDLVATWTGPREGEDGFAALVDQIRLALGIADLQDRQTNRFGSDAR